MSGLGDGLASERVCFHWNAPENTTSGGLCSLKHNILYIILCSESIVFKGYENKVI